MYFERFLPFLTEYGSFVRSKREDVNIDDVFCPLTTDKSLEELQKDAVVHHHIEKKLIKIIHVLPLDIKVFEESDLMSYYLKVTKAGQVVSAEVTYVDYYDVANNIEFYTGKAFYSKNGASVVVEDIISEAFVTNATNGVELDITTLDELGESFTIPLQESVSLFKFFETTETVDLDEAYDPMAMMSDYSGSIEYKSTSTDFIYKWLDGYFKLPEGMDMKTSEGREVVPLLIGPTGVFKSASIKTLCEKYNYRLVDFRVAFTSRLDFSGLYETRVFEDGSEYSYSCPMEELVVCSDGFRRYCIEAVKTLKDTLARGTLVVSRSSVGDTVEEQFEPIQDFEIEKIQETIKVYENYARTPVLFFDEITRNKNKGVEGVLVQLLNQKQYNNMTLTGCKFVAATNLDLESTVINDIYDVSDEIDKAYANRFFPLKVKPKDVEDRWFEWADKTSKESKGFKVGKSNIHPMILQFLKANPNFVYDVSEVEYIYENSQMDAEMEAATTPFPNYRSWDTLSSWLYAQDEDKDNPKTVNIRNIESVIGFKSSKLFLAFLLKNGYTEEVISKDVDEVGRFLESNLDADIPALIIGPSSMGKTGRVMAYADKVEKKTGARPEVIIVNLASMDSVDIMGMPIKKSVSKYVQGTPTENERKKFKNLNLLNKDLESHVADMAEYGVVDKLTVRAPDRGIKARFVQAMEEERMIILFFDECNRVTNSTVMSAVFECISDHRIFGIDYKDYKHNVRIVAACNLGMNYNGKSIDPALTARFSLYWKRDFDLNDVNSFLGFLEKQVEKGHTDGILLEYLKTLDKDDVLDFMRSVEEREIEEATPSSRMLFQMSKDIKNMRGNKSGAEFNSNVFNGTILFNTVDLDKVADYGNKARSGSNVDATIGEAKKLIADVKKKSVRWEGLLDNRTITVAGESVEMGRILEGLYMAENQLNTLSMSPNPDKKLISNILKFISDHLEMLADADYKIITERRQMFEAYAGVEFAQGFLPFFNERFGTANDVEITIEMLDDVSLIDDYFSRVFSTWGSLTPDLMVLEMMKQIDKFWGFWGARLPAINYAQFFLSGITGFASSSSVMLLLNKLGHIHDEFLARAETVGDNFILDVLKVFPKKITSDEITRLKAVGASGGTKAKRAKLL